MIYPNRIAGLLAIPLLAAVVGCDNGPPTAPVHGKVTAGGKPLPTGTIQFYSTTGGSPAVGEIRPDGTYTMARKVPGDEVVLGEYRVTIEAREITEDSRDLPSGPISVEQELEMGLGAGNSSPVKLLVPDEYSSPETSGLTATVTEGDNEINFDLP